MPTYPDIYSGPPRSYRRDGSGNPVVSRKKYITIHNTSNTATAEAEASYAQTRTDGTSSHYYVDNNSIVQSLNTDWCAGHVGSYQGNTYGICYEITGVNGWTRTQWLANVAWGLLAAQIAIDCRQFGIDQRLLTVEQMRAGTVTGFITHDLARQAWGGTTHTDPGPGFPMDHLIALVRQHLGGSGADDMTPEQDAKLNSVFQAVFDGGGSCGDWRKPTNGRPEGNSLVNKLDHIGEKIETLAKPATPPPATVDIPALVASLRPELDAAAERAVRKVLGSLDGA